MVRVRWRWGAPVLRAVAVALAAGGVLTYAGSAKAANPCGTRFEDGLFTGTQSTAANPYGARARIEKDVPALCSGTARNHASSAWVMLTGRGPGDGWAQVGYARWVRDNGSVGYKRFAQYTKKGSNERPPTRFRYSVVDNLLYTVVYHFGSHRMRMYAGTRRMLTTTFNPYTEWSTPLNTALAGETNYCATDIIGTPGDHADFNSIQMRNATPAWTSYSDLHFFPPVCASGPSAGRYHDAWGTPQKQFFIWTDPL